MPVQQDAVSRHGDKTRGMEEPRRIAMFRRHISGPVEIRRCRSLLVPLYMSPHGFDETGKLRRGHSAIIHGGEQRAYLYRVGIAVENDRERIHRFHLAERAAVADAHRAGCDIFGKPLLRIGIVADARKTVGDVFRCWLTFQKNAGAKRKRRRLHQHGPLPAACTGVGRGGGFFLRIVDKVLGLRRQRTNAQPHVFGKGGGTQALAGAQKKLIAISFAQLLQDAAHGRCRQSHARRRAADAAFPQQRIESDK